MDDNIVEKYCRKCGNTKARILYTNGTKLCICTQCNSILRTNFLSKQKPLVSCPYCNSTNTKKISSISKAGNVALFGIFALNKTSKQWHCNNCKSDF